MSDAEFAAPEQPVDAARDAVEELKRARSEGQTAPPEPMDDAEPAAVKISDGDDRSSLTAREGAKRVSELRRVEAERAAQYRDALGAGQRMDGAPAQPGEASVEQPAPADPDLDLQQRHAALETARQQFEAEQDVERRIGELDGEARNAAELIRKAAANFNTLFADVKSEADLRQLSQTDPQRFQLYQQCRDALDAGVRQVHATLAQQQEVKRAEWDKISTANDQYWESLHPELKTDPSKSQQIVEGAQRALDHVGIGGKDLTDLWEGRATVSLRDWRVQEVLALAGEAMRGRAAAEHVKANKSLPPVHRPGMRQAPGDDAAHVAEQARAALRGATGNSAVNLGRTLLQAERKAGRL